MCTQRYEMPFDFGTIRRVSLWLKICAYKVCIKVDNRSIFYTHLCAIPVWYGAKTVGLWQTFFVPLPSLFIVNCIFTAYSGEVNRKFALLIVRTAAYSIVMAVLSVLQDIRTVDTRNRVQTDRSSQNSTVLRFFRYLWRSKINDYNEFNARIG